MSNATEAIKLKPISFLILGMVRFGATSGYAIKKAADAATSSIWPVSLAQVYPELARLTNAGLLTRSEDPHGERTRSSYALTDRGAQALLAWLRSPHGVPFQIRSETFLRLFFADALPMDQQLALIRRARESIRYAKDHMYDGDLRAAAEALNAGEMRYPILLGAAGEDFYDFADQRIAKLEEDVKKGQ